MEQGKIILLFLSGESKEAALMCTSLSSESTSDPARPSPKPATLTQDTFFLYFLIRSFAQRFPFHLCWARVEAAPPAPPAPEQEWPYI